VTKLKKFIDEVGPTFFIQICTNNAINMLGAMDDIVTTYPMFSNKVVRHKLWISCWKIGQILTNSKT
jgi:hypothetical protein